MPNRSRRLALVAGLTMATALPAAPSLAHAAPPSVPAQERTDETRPPDVRRNPGPYPAPPQRLQPENLVAGQRWQVEPVAPFPERAALTGARAGEVVLICGVAPHRGLRDCRALRETPPGAGFGQSALGAMREARLVDTPELSSVDNPRVRITVNFTDGQTGRATLHGNQLIEATSPPRQ